jgi:AraC family L-rhamnose operon transcriptional activator RhaR
MNPRLYLWRNFFSEDDIVRVSFLVRNGSRVAHRHDYFEFVLVVSGRGNFLTDDTTIKLRRGKLIVIPPGINHAYSNCRQLRLAFCWVRPDVPESLSLLLGLRPSWLRQIGLARESRENAPSQLNLGHDELARCAAALETIAMGNRALDEVCLFARVGGFLLFIGTALQAVRKRSAASVSSKEAHPLTLRALSIVRSDLARNWSLTELCKLLQGVHPVYFCRVFKRDMEMTPIAYLRSLRCHQAARFLTTTDWRINEIGTRVGWDDPNLFARRFRTQTGLTPTAYRRAYRSHSSDHPRPTPLSQEGSENDQRQ